MSQTEPSGPSDAELRSILGDAETIAVVGLFSNPFKDSFEVAEFLQAKGYRIVPVNPNETEVLGERAYPSLLDVPKERPHRRGRRFPPRRGDAADRRTGWVAVGAKLLWLQDGIVNEEARRIAEDAGLTVIMGVCIRRTTRRLERGG